MAPAGGGGRGRGQNAPPSVVTFDCRQVAASNSTLNAWVGRRQPSWLTNATPVQPTPRAAQPTPPIPIPIPIPAPATEMVSSVAQPQPQPQSQPQSQPQPRPRPQSHLPHQSRRLSQPSPHMPSQPSGQSPRQSRQSLQPPPAPSPSAPLQPPQTAAVLGPPRLSPLAAPILPSPAPSDEPSPSLSLSHDSPDTRNLCTVSSCQDPPTTQAHFALDNHVNSDPLFSPHSREPASPIDNGQTTSPQGTIPAHLLAPASSTVDMAPDIAPTPTSAGYSEVAITTRDPPQLIAPKRRRIENNSLAFLESLGAHAMLGSFLQEVGGESGLEETVERPRFSLLRKACGDGDLFFVALHQLFCLWTASQASVHALCREGVHDTSLVDNAFGIMGSVLKANSKMGGGTLRWFADFPVHLSTSQPHPPYAQAINQALDFLICVSKKWTLVNLDHSLLGYPLLVTELINTFHLYSPILQAILFRASRRTIGVPDHPFGLQLDEMFSADQEKHRNPDDGTYSLRPEGNAYDGYNNELVQQYRSLVAQSKSTSTARFSGAPSPALVGAHLQTGMAQGLRPAPPQINTGRVVPNNQSIHSPSPTYSPINSPYPVISSNANPTFTPQFATMAPHVLPSSPSTRMVTSPYTSPYPSPNIPQQGQPGVSAHTQQSIQQRQYEQHLRQQQQQLQQQQQQQFIAHQNRLQQQQYLEWQQAQQQQRQQQPQQPAQQQPQQYQPQQYQQQPRQYQQHPQQYQLQLAQVQQLHRKRSQPGAAPSTRPSPVQTTRPLPSHVLSAEQPSPRFQNISNQSALAAHNRSLAPSSVSPALAPPPGVPDPILSPQTAHTVQPSNVRPRPVVGSQRQQTQASDRLIPAPGSRINLQDYPHTPYEKRSIDNALHQAHLRSPKRIHRGLPNVAVSERYYQAIHSFALEPIPVPPQEYIYDFTFCVSDAVYGKLTFNERPAGETLPVNRFSDGSLRIRLRCCSRPKAVESVESIPDHIWATSETTWPDHIFIKLNAQFLELKRKQHFSKDLPVEVSSFVRMGLNSLSISVPVHNPQKPTTPYIAVEIVEVLSHSSILRMVKLSGIRPANETREVIQRRLAGSLTNQAGEDDDLEIPNDGISIDLADPFTFAIFTIPVRGKACTHLECFDLENWLNTRLGKKADCVCGGRNCKCPKEPSFVDKWRCPLCDGDARPYSLRVDEFLVDVRKTLEQNNQLRTKSITVLADGSWKTNYSAEDDDTDLDSDDDSTPATSNTASKHSVPRTIIELDDD